MTESSDGPDRFYDENLVETSESLRDSNPENPELDLGTDENDTYAAADRYGVTAEEQRQGESLDLRLSEEEPDVGQPGSRATGEPDPVAGRIVEPDEGAHPNLEKDAIARDVGRDGGDYSAEEAALHVVDEP